MMRIFITHSLHHATRQSIIKKHHKKETNTLTCDSYKHHNKIITMQLIVHKRKTMQRYKKIISQQKVIMTFGG